MKQLRRHARRLRNRQRPILRFRPDAWAKLLHLRDMGPTEVGGFGISAPDDLLLIEDVRLVRQSSTETTVAFDDAAVADYFDICVDRGLPPERFARIWIHTHPGDSALPSGTDERTFARVFGGCDWAVMVILARGGERYARLRFNAGPGGALPIPVNVEFSSAFTAANPVGWAEEYALAVTPETGQRRTIPARRSVRDLAGAIAECSTSPGWAAGDTFEHEGFDRGEIYR